MSCCYLSGSPDYAVVDDAVELAKGRRAPARASSMRCCAGPRGRDRAPCWALSRMRRPSRQPSSTPIRSGSRACCGRRSAPTTRARSMAYDNEPGEVALRANTLVTDASTLAGELPARTRTDPGIPEALVLEEPFDIHGSPLWTTGAFVAQSRAAMLVARALAPRPGERVLDLCAAPGGKSTHLGRAHAGRRGSRRGRAQPAQGRRVWRARLNGSGRGTFASRSATRRRRGRTVRRSTACSSIRHARDWARCRRAPTCAGA